MINRLSYLEFCKKLTFFSETTGAATFGYLTFGSNVASDILQNYSAHDPFVMVALIAMALKTYTTYPILLFCGRLHYLPL